MEKFGFGFGADTFEISSEELEQLKAGKILAMDINGEYSAFLRVKKGE